MIINYANCLRELSIPEAGVTAVFGYCVVFVGLVLLMALLCCTGFYFKNKDAKKAEAEKKSLENISKEAEAAPLKITVPAAPGSAGHVKLYNVPDRDAAMIMAIVADKMQKPLNELHFISIKEVK